MSWTEEKIKKLKDLWGKGNTASQIAEIIGGGVSRNAVIGKAHRMNLSLKIKDNNINYKSNSQKSNENNKRVFSKGRKSKFRSFLIEKNFEPAKNLALEELTDSTCFKKAFGDFITNFIFHEKITKYLFKLINKKGVINVGGKIQSVYNFVKKYNPEIKKISAKKILGQKYPLNPSMNINKLKKIIK